MKINFSTRAKARMFSAQRTANGIKTRVIDNGKDAPKRYQVDVTKKAS